MEERKEKQETQGETDDRRDGPFARPSRFAVCFIRTIEVFFEKVLSLTQNQLFILERISIIEQPKEQKEDET